MAVNDSNRISCEIPRTTDFEVDGRGSAAAWAKAPWLDLVCREGPDYASRCKLLYSETGLYALYSGEDRCLTNTMQEDFALIYKEDVFEIFMQPNPELPLYLEYEISPLNYELVYLVPNIVGGFLGWRPVEYEGERKARHATVVTGGPKIPGANVTGWSAEMFIPFALFKGYGETPKPGTVWRGNLYRIDYDNNHSRHWTWAPLQQTNYHRHQEFGNFKFM